MSVTSNDPGCVTVNWLPRTDGQKGEAGLLLGRIEVVARTARPRLLDTTVTIAFADPRIQPLSLPVSGSVVPRVEVNPASLVLPRSTGGGPVFSGRCLVRGQDGSALRLELIDCPPDLKVELPGEASGGLKFVQITWVPAASVGTERKAVRLRAVGGDGSETFDIPVICEHPK